MFVVRLSRIFARPLGPHDAVLLSTRLRDVVSLSLSLSLCANDGVRAARLLAPPRARKVAAFNFGLVL